MLFFFLINPRFHYQKPKNLWKRAQNNKQRFQFNANLKLSALKPSILLHFEGSDHD